jgi:hypothetical protein
LTLAAHIRCTSFVCLRYAASHIDTPDTAQHLFSQCSSRLSLSCSFASEPTSQRLHVPSPTEVLMLAIRYILAIETAHRKEQDRKESLVRRGLLTSDKAEPL